MGQFRFEKRFITFDINGHKHKIEQNDAFAIKWDKIIQEVSKLDADKLSGKDTQQEIIKFKRFFRSKIYDALFGEGAYDEDFADVQLSVFDIRDLFIYISGEIQSTQNSRTSNVLDLTKQPKKPKTKPAKQKS